MIGLLWYDDNPQHPLETRISQAAARYREKFGRVPDTVHVHPDDGRGQQFPGCHIVAGHVAGCRVIPDKTILAHHLWIGEDPVNA